MMRLRWLLTVAIVTFTLGLSEAREHIFNFDADKAGEGPPEWQAESDPWHVIEERQAASKPHVLTPPQSVLTGGGMTHLLVSSATLVTGDLGVRFRTTRDDPASVFGLVWGYLDHADYQELEINTQTNNASVVALRRGKIHNLAQDSIVFTPNTWHLIQVQIMPKQLTVFLDNEVILNVRTSNQKKAGAIGLSAVPNSPLELDDFAWRNP